MNGTRIWSGILLDALIEKEKAMRMIRGMAAALLVASGALAQAPTDPFPNPIPATDGVIRVRYVEFAGGHRPYPPATDAAVRWFLSS